MFCANTCYAQYSTREDTSVSLPSLPSRMPDTVPLRCIIPGGPGRGRSLFFDRPALERLREQDGWLNDDCINAGSHAIMWHFSTEAARASPTLFPSWTFADHRAGRDDEAIWRVSGVALNFWDMAMWIIPIHREDTHWTLAIVYWQKHKVAYFDSFGSLTSCEYDCKVLTFTLNRDRIFLTRPQILLSLLHRLRRLAEEHGHAMSFQLDTKWKAYPLVVRDLRSV